MRIAGFIALIALAQAGQIICALGPAPTAYNAYADQRPTGDAMQLAGRVNSTLGSFCRPECPTLAMFRNTTAANIMLVRSGSQVRIVYNPEFFTRIYDTYGDAGILALLSHEVGHAIDATSPAKWMDKNWNAESRADAWAGCALAKMNLSPRALQAALNALSNLVAVRRGQAECGR